jgi:hypothetical protein
LSAAAFATALNAQTMPKMPRRGTRVRTARRSIISRPLRLGGSVAAEDGPGGGLKVDDDPSPRKKMPC